jgi:uncharacterized membrane protein YoaK (UPF0700 family)
MPAPVHLTTSGRILAALLLTLVGGFVDAIGWITLFHVFTANMSGNSIHVGMAAARADLATDLRFGCAIAAYVLALVVTRIALEAGARVGVRRVASFTFTAEVVLLLAFLYIASPLPQGHLSQFDSPLHLELVALLAFAMGMQTATLTHLGPLTVYTTFVTGTLTKFAESVTRVFFSLYDDKKRGMRWSTSMGNLPRNQDAVSSIFLMGIWLCYTLGAALGAFTKSRWELRALYIPVVVLVLLITLDLSQPIAGREAREQSAGSRPRAA